MRYKQILLILISLLAFALPAISQKLVNSPYSRFILGSMEPVGSFRSLGMGGVGVAMKDNTSVYFSNPASYSSVDTTSFVFDFGIDYSMNFLKDDKSEYFTDDMNFDHLIMSFPIKRGWGVSTGIIPISNGYYKMVNTVFADDAAYDPSVGPYASYHKGEGGFNNFFLGTGINITKNLSAGINMTILFGEVERLYNVDFADINNMYHNYAVERLQMGGVNFDYGLQYKATLSNNNFFNAGVSFTGGKSYNSQFNQLAYKYSAFGSKDTITYVADDSTRAFIPGTFRLGISFGKKDKFTAGFDYITTRWSEARIPGAAGYAADTRSFLFGLEVIPEKYSNYSFMKRIEYRLGAHYGKNYLYVHEEQIKEYGASIGFGFPMRRSLSKTNLFIDWTHKYGSIANGLTTENWLTIGASINLYDFWFQKRKYD